MCLGKSTKREREDGSGLQRSASQRNLVRSNSDGNLNRERPNADRNQARLGDKQLAREAVRDVSVITVYSREASISDKGRGWRERMLRAAGDPSTMRSRPLVNSDEATTLISRQNRVEISTGFEGQLNALVQDKMIPHVIAVIEGREEQSSVSLRVHVAAEDINLGYTRADYIQGINIKNRIENRQSMSVYVRDDLKETYTFTREEIQRSPGEPTIKAIGVNFQTEDGTRYRSLVVHIQNDYVGSDITEGITHKAFVDYAQNAAALPEPIVVTSYMGDTNFSSGRYENTLPSLGGRTDDRRTLNPQSSPAKDDTFFMQHVPLDTHNDKYTVLQSSTLNYVFPTQDYENGIKTATDHPSTNNYIGLPSELRRNPEGNSNYYEMAE